MDNKGLQVDFHEGQYMYDLMQKDKETYEKISESYDYDRRYFLSKVKADLMVKRIEKLQEKIKNHIFKTYDLEIIE